MTLDLSRIETLLAGVTEGPWYATGGVVWVEAEGALICCNNWVPDHNGEALCCGRPVRAQSQVQIASSNPDDAAFIAAARTDVPLLVQRVRELEAALGPLVELCGHVQPMRQSLKMDKIVPDGLFVVRFMEAYDRAARALNPKPLGEGR